MRVFPRTTKSNQQLLPTETETNTSKVSLCQKLFPFCIINKFYDSTFYYNDEDTRRCQFDIYGEKRKKYSKQQLSRFWQHPTLLF